MKKICLFILCATAIMGSWQCNKKDNYPGGVVSTYISIFDVKNIYKGKEVILSPANMFGAEKLSAIVVSDHIGGNIPAGLLVVQDSRRLGKLRGISIMLGTQAADYVPGDLLEIDVVGATLKKENGILVLAGISTSMIAKISSNNTVEMPIVKANALLGTPSDYESTLISIAKVGFDASYPAGTTYLGDKIINDGFGNVFLHTEATASFANKAIPFLSNYTGIVFNVENDTIPRLWPRNEDDIVILSATAPKIAPIVITGYLTNPPGSDANYEYVQLLATRDINFAVTNFSIVVTNNAGANTPTGFPTLGWATGDKRTYKIDMKEGVVKRGTFIYVGANKNIWGDGSTDISSSFWFSKMYSNDGGDGFGTATTNLLANSGNAAGIAIFDLTAVVEESIPVDVMFYGGNGSMYTAGPPEKGYRIANTDYYDITNPTTLDNQPFYGMGSNITKLSFPAGSTWVQLGGSYNTTTGRWTSARTLNAVDLTTTSTVVEIETATTLEQ